MQNAYVSHKHMSICIISIIFVCKKQTKMINICQNAHITTKLMSNCICLSNLYANHIQKWQTYVKWHTTNTHKCNFISKITKLYAILHRITNVNAWITYIHMNLCNFISKITKLYAILYRITNIYVYYTCD